MNDFTYVPKITHTTAQKRIEESPARFKYVKAGRRFGKTKYASDWQIRQALTVPHEEHWYVAPSYRMAHEIAWRDYLDQIPQELMVRVNERELYIQLINGARIAFKGSEEEDSLRGRRLGSLVMDEAALHKPNVYNQILRPMLADLLAPAMFISSPKRSWFSTAWEQANSGKYSDSAAFHFSIYDNPYISRDEIERIKAETPENVWRQEYLAEESEMDGQVYTEFKMESIFNPSTAFVGHSKLPCVLGLDWGHYDDTAAVWLHFLPNGHVVVSREHLKNNWDAAKHSDVIKVNSRGRDIKAYVMDRTAFRKDGGSAAIADQFREHLGVPIQRSEKDQNIGIDLMKRYLRGDNGPWLHVSSGCKEVIKAFEGWEHGQHEPDALAALRYGLVHAVRLGLTNLAQTISSGMNTDFLADPYELAQRLPMKRRSVTDRMSWDSEGIPNFGGFA